MSADFYVETYQTFYVIPTRPFFEVRNGVVPVEVQIRFVKKFVWLAHSCYVLIEDHTVAIDT